MYKWSVGHCFNMLLRLFRSTDLPTRKRYVKLVESVKENGGDIRSSDVLETSFINLFLLLVYWFVCFLSYLVDNCVRAFLLSLVVL